MVTYLQLLGILSVIGGAVGIFEFAQIDLGYGATQFSPYLVAMIIGGVLVSFGVFWGLATIIYNLQQLNEKMDKKR